MAKPLLSFYGDDFTGSSAVMEVLTFAGVQTVMFLEPPTAQDLAMFPDIQALGIAGIARSQDPDWMAENLPAAFASLAEFGAPVAHYKVCSTFDSSPDRGSIGAAIDIGAPVLGGQWHPLVVGAPAINRYQVFGNLFAGIDGENFRLDRHPIMKRHPVTPMDESDLRVHLGRQTSKPVALLDFVAMKSGQSDFVVEQAQKDTAPIIAIDMFDDETMAEAGRLIWKDGDTQTFAIGSQGVEYALVAHWRETGLLPGEFNPAELSPVDQVFCVSGSCSAINARQIETAEAHGFVVVELDAAHAVHAQNWAKEQARARTEATALLSQGRDVIVTTARGPDDPALTRTNAAIAASGMAAETVNEMLGQALGELVAIVRRDHGIKRVAVAGGDTSGHATTALKAKALSALSPLAPGAPLCRVHSADQDIDGLEITLKGGQMGTADFFVQVKGTPT
ncbi:MAG: four-carbon acid sugar kinase family protein [Marinosulfonomonas sp.]